MSSSRLIFQVSEWFDRWEVPLVPLRLVQGERRYSAWGGERIGIVAVIPRRRALEVITQTTDPVQATATSTHSPTRPMTGRTRPPRR